MSHEIGRPIEALQPSKSEIIENYLSFLDDQAFNDEADGVLAMDVAEQLHIPGKPLNKTVIIIPVAAVAEQSTIGHAIDEYGRQNPRKPFSVVLGLNVDVDEPDAKGASDPAVLATFHNLANARARHPNLDIRSSFMEYCSPTIGGIRRDLWNGVLMTYRKDGISPTEEMVGINHDIDVIHIPRHYIARIQDSFDGPNGSSQPAYGQVRHGWDAQHPNTSKAVLWSDFAASASHINFEAGAVIPMSFYAEHGGINSTLSTYEVASLTNGHTPLKALRTGRLVTSPRRFVDRLPVEGQSRIWTDESFGSNDACRDPDYIANRPDLSEEELRKILFKGTLVDTAQIVHTNFMVIQEEIGESGIIDKVLGKTDVIEMLNNYITLRIDKKLRLAQRVLDLCQPEGPLSTVNNLSVKHYSYQIRAAAQLILSEHLRSTS